MSELSNRSLAMQSNEDERLDAMYNSIRSLTNSKAQKRLRKVSSTPTSFKENKELTFTLNEVNFTDGHGAMLIPGNESKLNKKRNLFNKTIRSIGTSLKNCEISDTISIDIEAESTKLPLMCKLMIIVEGAAFERGTCVLVRDAAIQVDNQNDFESNSNEKYEELPIILSLNEKRNQMHNQFDQIESSRSCHYYNKYGRYKSSDNIDIDDCNEHFKNNNSSSSKRVSTSLIRNVAGGSLSNISSSSPISIYSEDCSNYFNRTSRNHMLESHLNLYEYTSTPYYQYQRKNLSKKDFSNAIQEEFYEFLHMNNLIDTCNSHETVELHIPIKLITDRRRNEVFRNEKRFFVNRDLEINNSNNFESIRSLKKNMRRYIDERFNRFEAEITFYNLANENIKVNCPVMSLRQANIPVTHGYYFQNESSSLINRRRPSVTNLMYLQIVDGQIVD